MIIDENRLDYTHNFHLYIILKTRFTYFRIYHIVTDIIFLDQLAGGCQGDTIKPRINDNRLVP